MRVLVDLPSGNPTSVTFQPEDSPGLLAVDLSTSASIDYITLGEPDAVFEHPAWSTVQGVHRIVPLHLAPLYLEARATGVAETGYAELWVSLEVRVIRLCGMLHRLTVTVRSNRASRGVASAIDFILKETPKTAPATSAWERLSQGEDP